MPVLCRIAGRPRARLSRAWAERAGARMLSALRLEHCELSIVLCDAPTIRKLNAAYRGDDHATDVLAFPLLEGPHQRIARDSALLGDVVISLDTAAAQAAARQVPLAEESEMLLAHGLLHLLGHDHRDRTEERRMSARTDALRSVALGGLVRTRRSRV